MSPPSLERALLRTYVLSVVGVALAVVAVGTVATTAVVIGRDDGQAVALAKTLGTEIRDNAELGAGELDSLVAHELEEQHWFDRTLEVWRGEGRVGGATAEGRLGGWARGRGCRFADVEATLVRVCAVRYDATTSIVVASPLRPLLLAELPIVAAIALSAFLAAGFFTVAARRLVRGGLSPLRAFERRLGSLGGLEARGIETAWGAEEIDDLARAFDELLGRIHVAVSREQRFVSNAAHELRTPLTRLRGQIDLVADRVVGDDESVRRLALAARSCDELSGAVDALLALARDRVDAKETVDLAELAFDAPRGLGSDEAARIRVETAPAVVRGDPRLLGLALRNLVDNALKYSDGPIQVRTYVGGDRCEVEVSDQGPGIPEAELSTVREAFERGARAATHARGMGLGLPLAEHVAELHGGVLTLRNARPLGLEARLSFPVWVPASEGDEPPPGPPR